MYALINKKEETQESVLLISVLLKGGPFQIL